MYELTQIKNGKYVLFVWNDKKQKAFDNIKKRITIALIVAYSNFKKPFILYMDASKEDIRVVLYQKDD